MLDALQLTKNAQFYRVQENLTDEVIQNICDAATSNKLPNSQMLIDSVRAVYEPIVSNTNDPQIKISVKCFPTQRDVYFLDKDIYDTIYAYLIFIEIEDFVAILSKSCGDFSHAYKGYLEKVSVENLSSIFNDDKVEFQKMSLRNMTISDRAIRSKSYEAANLKGVLSLHAAGRAIPYYFKIRENGALKAISSNSGRIVESSQRASLNVITEWVKRQIKLLKEPSGGNNNFLEKFAKNVELKHVLSQTAPSSILIETLSLFDLIEGNSDLEIKFKTKKGIYLSISNRAKNTLYKELEKVFEINDAYEIINEFGSGLGSLKKNNSTLTLNSKILKKYRVVSSGDNENSITLQSFLVKHKLYTITFQNPRYMYFMGSCFEDVSGISEVSVLLDILTPIDNLLNASSEKGSFSSASTSFSNDSLFYIVEEHHNNDDYIFCDDLVDEWADHITFNQEESSICFIHSKHSELGTGTSASKLHEVVGQGIKNLGNMFFDNKDFFVKDEKFNSNYKSSGGTQTQISRIRKGDMDCLEEVIFELTGNYRLLRKCILCCSFLSKENISEEFSKIKDGQPVKGHIVQLFWLISSFAHAAKEANVQPEIYCRP